MNFSFKQEVVNRSVVHAHAVNGIFRIGRDMIDFQATSFKRFQVAVAYCMGSIFRLKYAFNAQENGITCYSVEKQLENRDGVRQYRRGIQLGVYQIPSDLDLNTALIIGIVPADQSSAVNFQTHDNGNGNGNDIDGKVTWNLIHENDTETENIAICDSLKAPPSTQSSFGNDTGSDDDDANDVENQDEPEHDGEKDSTESIEPRSSDNHTDNSSINDGSSVYSTATDSHASGEDMDKIVAMELIDLLILESFYDKNLVNDMNF